MRQIFYWIIPILFLLSCQEKNTHNSSDENNSADVNFPITDIIKGDLFELEKAPITPLKIITRENKMDSIWQKREDIRPFATPFLLPVLDSTTLSKFFKETSFLDKTVNAFTIVYELKDNTPNNLPWRHGIIYIDPTTNKVQKIYLVKTIPEDQSTTMQLTWVINKSCSIRTITTQADSTNQIVEEKMIWNFD